MRVLIVDDSPEAISVAKVRLAKEGLEVLIAGGGRTGLESARRDKPDLILLDVDMPDLSGFEVCRMLKQDGELCMIPVIFLTASDNTDDKIKGLDLGAVDYVTKPFNAFELRARVRAALRTKRLQDLLVRYSHIDPLTELWNRRALTDRLHQEWARYQRHSVPFAVIMADLDQFKTVNDRFGHSMGDYLLQEVAKVFIQQSRDCDLPVRHGGEEFAILLPGESADKAAILAERCRRGIEEIRVTADDNSVIQTTASFGIADTAGQASGEGLIECADGALYEAKSRGRNRVEQATPAQTDAPPQDGAPVHSLSKRTSK